MDPRGEQNNIYTNVNAKANAYLKRRYCILANVNYYFSFPTYSDSMLN